MTVRIAPLAEGYQTVRVLGELGGLTDDEVSSGLL